MVGGGLILLIAACKSFSLGRSGSLEKNSARHVSQRAASRIMAGLFAGQPLLISAINSSRLVRNSAVLILVLVLRPFCVA